MADSPATTLRRQVVDALRAEELEVEKIERNSLAVFVEAKRPRDPQALTYAAETVLLVLKARGFTRAYLATVRPGVVVVPVDKARA